MHSLEKIRDMLMDELEKCSQKTELTSNSLENIDKLTHAVKSIDTIMAMEDAGYSNDYSYDNRGRGSDARRDSMGRYADSYDRSYGGSYRNSYRRGNSYRRYSRDDMGYSREDAKANLMANLRDMSRDADGEQKQMIDEWMRQVEQR